jgi:hypothetical protein
MSVRAKLSPLRRAVFAAAVVLIAFLAFGAILQPAAAQYYYPYYPYYYPYTYPYSGYWPVGVTVGWGWGWHRPWWGWRAGWGWHPGWGWGWGPRWGWHR